MAARTAPLTPGTMIHKSVAMTSTPITMMSTST